MKDPHQFTQGEAIWKCSPNAYGPKTDEVSCSIKESYESSSRLTPQKSQMILLLLETSFTPQFMIASRHQCSNALADIYSNK